MLGLPKNYEQRKRFNKKLFISKDESLNIKKKIKDSLLKISLVGQVQGNNIPSLVNENFNASVIMFLEVEVDNIKNAKFLNGIFQELLKAFAIIKFYDYRGNNVYGFGYKRLSKNDKSEIVLESYFVSEVFTEELFDETLELFEEYIDFSNIKNTNNKLYLYEEIMVKAYVISNKNLWGKWRNILESNIWYNHSKINEIFKLLREVKDIKDKQKKIKNINETIGQNKELIRIYSDMERMISE
ncbi:DUF4391 domain-containing protein [Clostridium perfringens]|nr:DUF4391 domain-containing protein [Clostridium perfringens]HAT4276202.1 DUF4391 domain-containing protein [Clostridium perfringens]